MTTQAIQTCFDPIRINRKGSGDSISAEIGAGLLLVFLGLPMGSVRADAILVDETFAGLTAPTGWIINGRDGGDNFNPTGGTAIDDAYWFQDGANPLGHFHLTDRRNFQRTTALYSAGTFDSRRDFRISAEIRVESIGGLNGADGISFFWLNAASLDVNNLNQYQGGYGGWQGAPRGNNSTQYSQSGFETNYGVYGSTDGFYDTAVGPSLEGYSFEFDHYQNAQERAQQYNHLVKLDEWRHMPSSNINFTDNPDYYEDVGWVSFEMAFSADSGIFTVDWFGANGASGTDTLEPGDLYQGFDQTYFGLSSATGGQSAAQDVRNVIVEQIPLPGTIVLILIGLLGMILRTAVDRFVATTIPCVFGTFSAIRWSPVWWGALRPAGKADQSAPPGGRTIPRLL